MYNNWLKLLKLSTLVLLALPAVSWADESAQTESTKLTGTVIGTESCYDYSTGAYTTTVNTPANAFDGDMETFVATASKSNTWVGLDLGTPHVITKVGWSPRNASNGPGRVQLALFEGANDPNFLDAVPLYLIDQEGTIGTMSYADINVTRGFRYVRYCGPSESRSNVAELEFYGYEGEGDDSHFYQVTNLPTLSYHTYSGADPTSKTTELEANMCLVYEDGTLIQEYPILARIRGNASANFTKKPYRIKFNDGKSHHMMKGGSLESPAKAVKWTLINNYGDKTLMRNCIAFETSRRFGMAYTVYCQPVDVIVNGEYKGCYQLCDQITADENRVPITEMEPTDVEEPNVTGGYLVEIDAYASGEKSWFQSNKGIPVTIKEPGEDDIVPAQASYVKGAFNLMETALWSSTYKDPDTGYRSKLDLTSFLKHFLVGEYSGNTDTYWSVYMYKDREENQFHVGPSWDFDLAYNNDVRTYPVCSKSDWIYRSGGSGASGMNSFVNRIIGDSGADAELKELWKEIRDSGRLTKENITAYIDSTAEVLQQSQRLNFLRWPILNQRVHENPQALGSYDAEVDVVREYCQERIDWIDNKLGYGSGGGGEETPTGETYDISTPDELLAFMKRVNNSGDVTANANLKADIDMTSINSQFKPIGSGSHMYQGTFDGEGHKISNLNINSTADYVGFFGTVADGATIKNLVLDSSCSISGGAFVGLIGGSNSSGDITMSRLGNEGTVTAKNQNAGGIIGCDMSSSAYFVIENCYATGTVSGGNESAAISGWTGSGATISGCYSTATVNGVEGDKYLVRGSGFVLMDCYDVNGASGASKITQEQAQSGELCYAMNGGETDTPIWYQTLGSDDHPVLDNTHAVVLKENGTYTNASLTMDIATASDLQKFATIVNGGRTSIEANLTADLDLKDVDMVPIGTEAQPYRGTFHGNGHVLSNLTIKQDGDFAGLFGVLGNGANISYLVLDNTCSITGANYCGLIGGTNSKATITLDRLGNEGDVTGQQNIAGIIGCNKGSTATFNITNCFATGTITGTHECAALAGWMGSEGTVTNCYSCATVTGIETGKNFARYGSATLKNCYDTGTAQTGVTKVLSSRIASGYVCYMLNGKQSDDCIYFQTLGADKHPTILPHAPILKQGTMYKNQTEYEIAEPGDLAEFARLANTGLSTATARLTADLDMKGVTVTPIGTSTYPFKGTLDGQEHIISNLAIQGGDYTGLVGYVSDGATIENLTLDKTCSISGAAFVGMIGGSTGSGTITMLNLGNEGNVTASAQNAGGIIGCNMSSAATFLLTNCYNAGTVKGANESGALSGWVGNDCVATNCYNIGTTEGLESTDKYLMRYSSNLQTINCYSTLGSQVDQVTEEQVKSGELCYLLGKDEETKIFRQTLDQDDHPILQSTHMIVYQKKDGTYTNNEELDAIRGVDDEGQIESIYTPEGIRRNTLGNGIQIIRMKNGTIRKIKADK